MCPTSINANSNCDPYAPLTSVEGHLDLAVGVGGGVGEAVASWLSDETACSIAVSSSYKLANALKHSKLQGLCVGVCRSVGRCLYVCVCVCYMWMCR